MKKWILSAVIGIALVLSFSAVALADPTPTPAPTATPAPTPTVAEIEGKITVVDKTANKVTIASDNTTSVALNVTDTTSIEVGDNDSATIADLAVGQLAEAKYETATLNALKIEVEGVKAARIDGQITVVDTAASKVTIASDNTTSVTLNVTDKTDIQVWGKDPATIADLKVGDQAKALYDPTTKDAISIQIKAKGEQSLGVRQGFFGTVKSVASGSLVITAKQGDVTFVIDANTQFWNPPQKNATLADVKVGDRVAVLAVKNGSTLTAQRVLIIPAKPVRTQVSGTVTAINGNTVTLTDKDGKTYTFDLPKGQVAKLSVGSVLTVTLIQTPGGDKYIVQGSMRGDEMKDRLNNFVNKVKDAKQQQQLDKLDSLIQRNMDRQQEMMQKVLDKVPAQAKGAVQKAMENSRQGWQKAKDAIGQAKGQNKQGGTPTPARSPAASTATATPHGNGNGKK